MEKMRQCTFTNVITVRVTDEQMMFLNHLREKRDATVSQLIREVLVMLDFHYGKSGKTLEDGIFTLPVSEIAAFGGSGH